MILSSARIVAQDKTVPTDSNSIAETRSSISGENLEDQGKSKCRIYGTVVDEATREPISKAKISVLGTKYSATTSADGQYMIESIPEGLYQIKAEAAEYEPKTINNYSLEEKSTKSGPLFFMKKKNQEPPEFVEVEKQPTPTKQVQPAYPEAARRAGAEGTVWISIWIDAQGNPKKAKVIKSDAEVFNQAALDAAMQWRFTPAVLKKEPVAVWVAIPFKFKLNGGPPKSK
jgi:TonB family protein